MSSSTSNSTSGDLLSLKVDGRLYGGVVGYDIDRAIDKCVAEANIILSEKWLGQDEPWRIAPFDKIEVMLGRDVVLTGYAVAYEPRAGAEAKSVHLVASSRTCDLVECTPDIQSGQYKGYALKAIATAICGLFNIPLQVDPSAANAVQSSVADATIERCETAWTFLERLCRLAGVLACDTPSGALLLTRLGNTRAAGRVVQGENVIEEQGRFDVRHRYSVYIVKGQSGVGGGAVTPQADPYAGTVRVANQASYTPAIGRAGGTGKVLIGQHAQATDAGVPRYRPHVSIAESQLTQAGMQLRATWQRNYAFGRSTQVEVTVKGLRQPDGSLWSINQIVSTVLPRVGIDQDLLVVRVRQTASARHGRNTTLTLAPPEGYTPDPGEVKLRKHKGAKKGKKGKAIMDLTGLQSVAGN